MLKKLHGRFNFLKQYFLSALFAAFGRRRFTQFYFEKMFAAPDPWGFEKREYERIKYRQTLDSLPPINYKRILEIGCAEGLFTKQLAHIGNSILAVDISERALARASERCLPFKNIGFRRLDVINEDLDGLFDLVICSEVLCFSETLSTLNSLCNKLVAWVEPEGYLLLVHLRVRREFPKGWHAPDLRFGADSIHPMFERSKELSLVSERWRDLYAISLFKNETKETHKPIS